jgi:hypothetical protein
LPIESSSEDSDGAASDLTTILGKQPKANQPGKEVHAEVAARWTHFLREGVEREEKTALYEKHPIPANCQALSPPKLNGEIEASVSDALLKQDKFLQSVQEAVAHGLAAISGPLNEGLLNKDAANQAATLAEAAKILCNMHHAVSVHRKFNIIPSLSTSCKKVMGNTKIDDFLFGSSLQEDIKSSQTISKLSSELKKNTPRPPFQPKPAYPTTKPLNYRRGPHPPRFKKREEPTTSRKWTNNNNRNDKNSRRSLRPRK